jgi:hypothetical protein
MSDLIDLQSAFKTTILSDDNTIAGDIVGSAAEKQQRLNIYKHAYRQRMLATLRLDYPVLLSVLGGQVFNELALQFIQHLQSDHPAIHFISRGFASFLSGVNAQYVDLANIEWGVDAVLAAKAQTILTQEALLELAQSNLENAVFKLVDATCLLRLNSNALDVWRVHEQGEDLPSLIKADVRHVICWRETFVARWLELDEAQTCVISAIQAGETFGSICELLCHYLPENKVPAFAINTLQSLLSKGLLVAESII